MKGFLVVGTPGSGDRCHFCTILDSAGRVSETAASYSVADAGSTVAVADHASAVDPHAAVASQIHAACSDSDWGSTATGFALAWSAYHNFDDSSITA